MCDRHLISDHIARCHERAWPRAQWNDAVLHGVSGGELWLEERLKELGSDAYVVFDLPGQVEISTNHDSLKRIV
jgi:hypothetical protein